MIKKLLQLSLVALPVFSASAITYTYGHFNNSAKTCMLMSWGGNQPSSGKLTLKNTYEKDGVTYRVTAIAPHALDNLTTVTEITIPSNIVAIGDAKGDYLASCFNFNNCPELKTFKVSEDNPQFKASGAGILMRKELMVIVRVPENLQIASGHINLSVNTKDICPDAFAGNRTISSIALPPNIWPLSSNCGFNFMTALNEFKVNGSDPLHFSVKDGILYDADGSTLLSFPPARTDANFTIPAGVTAIGPEAFSNTTKLESVDLNEVVSIGVRSFFNCGMTEFEFPNREIEVRKGAFSGNRKLQHLVLPYRMDIPEDFARDCPVLNNVYVHYPSSTFGDAAFKNCTSLETFNFNPEMKFEGDSVFANCGFREITFSTGTVGADGVELGNSMFDGCKNLTKIDFSGILMTSETSGILGVSPLSMSNCPALREVILPRCTNFWSAGESGYPTFGVNSGITKLVIGDFIVSGYAPFVYRDAFVASPEIYVRTTDALCKSWPFNKFMTIAGGAEVNPVIFTEAYTMTDAMSGDESEYVLPEASYYVPGGSFNNYAASMQSGCSVKEMFAISWGDEGGVFTVGVHPLIDEDIQFVSLTVNDNYEFEIGPDGTVVTTFDPDEVLSYALNYTVNGVSFKTRYPSPKSSGMTEIVSEGIAVSSDKAFFGSEADYSVSDMHGRVVLSGRGDACDITGLDKGIYVISAIYANGTAKTLKVSR